MFQINFYSNAISCSLEASGWLTPFLSVAGAIYDLNFFMVERADGWRVLRVQHRLYR